LRIKAGGDGADRRACALFFSGRRLALGPPGAPDRAPARSRACPPALGRPL